MIQSIEADGCSPWLPMVSTGGFVKGDKTMTWVYGASNPAAWTTVHFSPIIRDSMLDYVVYVGGYNIAEFYKYHLRTDVWERLADPPVALYSALDLSPDGTKLATVGFHGRYVYIYDIATDTWTTSVIAPHIPAGTMLYLHIPFWLDDDTIWVMTSGYIGVWRGRLYRYVVSTGTWTQFANFINPTYQNGKSMSINTLGTNLYVGYIGAGTWGYLRYVIATDTYVLLNAGADNGYRFYGSSDRNARLWAHSAGLPNTARYYNCDTETLSGAAFIADPLQDDAVAITCGLYGTEHIIAQHMLAEPKNRIWNTFISLPYIQTDPATGVTR